MNVTLNDVKNALGITGDYQNDTMQIYFDEVIDYLMNAGVNESNITVTTHMPRRGRNDSCHFCFKKT